MTASAENYTKKEKQTNKKTGQQEGRDMGTYVYV